MIGNKFSFLKKKQRDDNYVCPHTLVYDIEFGDREPTDVTYYFLLKNTACSSGATIDFGDGVVSTNVRSNPDYDALSAATILSHTYANASGTYRVAFDMNDISKFKRPYEGSDFALFGISAPYWQIATSGTAYVIQNDVLLQNKKYWTWADKFIGINKNESWYPITIVDFNEIELCSALYNWPVFSHVNNVKMSNRQFQKLQSNSLLHRSGNFNSVVSPIHHLELGENGHSPHGYGYAKCIFPDLTNISIKKPIKAQTFQDVNVRTINNETQYFNDNIITVNEMPSMSDVLSGAYFAGLGCKCLDFSKLSSYTTICTSLCESSNAREVILPSSINKIEKFAFETSLISSINLENIETIGEYAFCDCPLVSANLNNLVSIDEGAFDSCEKMTSINIPRLSAVSDRVFRYCTSLSSINIPCATYIGYSAIRYCDSLISADFPNVTYIDIGGIEQCESLTYVNVSSAIEIGDWAFFYDTALTSVNIENATFLGESAFEGCYALTGINAKNVRSLSCNWTFWGCSSLISADIRSATSIGKEVFEDCFALKYVDARSAKTLGSNAFNNCNSLEVVNLSSVQSLANGAFQQTRLKSIDISNLPTINDSVFYGCADLIDVKATNATTIENKAFGACTSLSTINLPNVITIKNNAFLNCNALSAVSFNTVKTIYPSAFSGCSSIVSANVAGLNELDQNVFKDSKNSLEYIDASGLSAVESGCFSNFYNGYTKLKSVNVSGAETIGESAFDSTASLLEINASNARTIEDTAFYGCDKLSSLNLSKATYIGEGALDKCSSLIYLNVASMPTLDHDIFVECRDSLQFIDASGLSAIESGTFSSLTELLSANINRVTEIGPSAFCGCSSLQHINADNAAKISGYAFTNCLSLSSISLPNVTEIQNQSSVFYGCSSLLSLNLANLSSVESSLFDSCRTTLQDLNISSLSSIENNYFGKYGYNDNDGWFEKDEFFSSLSSINISGAEIISAAAFDVCESLKNINITNAHTIGEYAFEITSITSVDAPNAEIIEKSAFFRCEMLTNANLSNVYTIDRGAFSNCISLSSVNLSHVNYIGEDAFYNCESLENVNISSALSIGEEAFDYCISLSSVNAESLSSIPIRAFSCCYSLTDINIRNVKCIYRSGFDACHNLSSVNSEYLLSAGPCAFTGCSSLILIDLSNTTYIGDYAFEYCCSLSSVDLQNVKYIGTNAFSPCSITSVFASNVEFIDKSAFEYHNPKTTGGDEYIELTPTLKTVYLDGPITQIYGSCFYNQSSLSSVHLPSGLKYIGNSAFYNTGLTSIALPSTITRIDMAAFQNTNLINGAEIPSSIFWNDAAVNMFCNSNIQQVKLPNVDIIPSWMFAYCQNLSSVKIPESVKYFEKGAFANCTMLSSIQLPSDLKYIEKECFLNCSALTSLEFPSSISYIGNGALSGCSNLSSVRFNSIFNLSSQSFDFGDNNNREIILPWSQDDIAGEPWGAGSNTTFIYTNELNASNILSSVETGCEMPEPRNCIAYIPFTHDLSGSMTPVEMNTMETGTITKGSTMTPYGLRTDIDGHRCFYFGYKTSSFAYSYPGIFGLKYTQCLSGLPSTGSISMSMWLNPRVKISNSDSNGYAFVLLGQKVNNECLFLFGRRKDDRLYAGTWGSDLGNTIAYPDQVGSWWHQVIVYDDENHILKFYMNDELVDTKSLTISITTKELNIGYTNRQDKSAYFHDLRIYTKALTPANIHWLYEHKC